MDSEFLKKLRSGICTVSDRSKWIQVGKLESEEILKHRTLEFEKANLMGEVKVLLAKAETIKARGQLLHCEFWEALHKTHSLPREDKYTIDEENRIFRVPKEEVSICFCGNCK